MENSKQPAFPASYTNNAGEITHTDSLTKREYFAGLFYPVAYADVNLMSSAQIIGLVGEFQDFREIAATAYAARSIQLADALLTSLSGSPE